MPNTNPINHPVIGRIFSRGVFHDLFTHSWRQNIVVSAALLLLALAIGYYFMKDLRGMSLGSAPEQPFSSGLYCLCSLDKSLRHISRPKFQRNHPLVLHDLNLTLQSLWKLDGYIQNLWMKTFG